MPNSIKAAEIIEEQIQKLYTNLTSMKKIRDHLRADGHPNRDLETRIMELIEIIATEEATAALIRSTATDA